MQARGRLQTVAALRGRTRGQRVPRQPARDRRLPAVARCARIREGQRRPGYGDGHLGRRHPPRQRRALPGPRLALPPHSACRRRQSPAGGWIVRLIEPGFFCSTTLKEIEHGEEKSEKRRKEKEEEESITKKEISKKSRKKGGRQKEIRQEEEK